MAGTFEFLNQQRDLPDTWDAKDVSPLWRYELHYLLWAWAFATHTDPRWARQAFTELWTSWAKANALGRQPAWAPYPTATRAWTMCAVFRPLVQATALEDTYVGALRIHARVLRATLERDLGGNHLVRNLKALVGLAVFFNDQRRLRWALRQFAQTLSDQVLPDGGHIERSPYYHLQVLADLDDVIELLRHAGKPIDPRMESLRDSMRAWASAMLHPDGNLPLFHDGSLAPESLTNALGVAFRPATSNLVVLEESGYAVMRSATALHLIADVGDAGADHLPGHTHASCLSFELSVDQQRVIVDSGTFTYQPSPRRQYERSTAAHNTIEVDRQDQSELWGSFRVGRRARARVEGYGQDSGTPWVAASHDGYTRLPGAPRHRRTFRATSGLEILDEVVGAGTHDIRVFLVFAPDMSVQQTDERSVSAGPIKVTFDTATRSVLTLEKDTDEPHGVAEQQGHLRHSVKAVLRLRTALPTQIVTRIERTEPAVDAQ